MIARNLSARALRDGMSTMVFQRLRQGTWEESVVLDGRRYKPSPRWMCVRLVKACRWNLSRRSGSSFLVSQTSRPSRNSINQKRESGSIHCGFPSCSTCIITAPHVLLTSLRRHQGTYLSRCAGGWVHVINTHLRSLSFLRYLSPRTQAILNDILSALPPHLVPLTR